MAITYDVTTGLRALDGSNLISDIDTGLLSMAQDISNQRHALQAGVIDSGSYMAVQKAAGANMSVDVGSNSGRGMYVTDTSSRLVYVAPTGSATNVAVTAAHATLPRVDAVVVSSAGVVSVIAGTPTSGATLDNARDGSHGGAAVPSGSQLIADILVGATVTTIPNTKIRDRRPWARGAYCQIGTSSTVYIRSSATLALIDSTLFNPRIECSGAPVRVRFSGSGIAAPAATLAKFDLFVDGASISLAESTTVPSSSGAAVLDPHWEFVPAAGSHLIGPAWASDGTNLLTIAGQINVSSLVLTVKEIVRQNSANNSVTSG